MISLDLSFPAAAFQTAWNVGIRFDYRNRYYKTHTSDTPLAFLLHTQNAGRKAEPVLDKLE